MAFVPLFYQILKSKKGLCRGCCKELSKQHAQKLASSPGGSARFVWVQGLAIGACNALLMSLQQCSAHVFAAVESVKRCGPYLDEGLLDLPSKDVVVSLNKGTPI